METRHRTFAIQVGDVTIGGGAPISVQTMTNTCTNDKEATLAQIKELAQKGAQLIRVAVPDIKALTGFKYVVSHSPVPLVADIHFDYRLAIKAIEAGAQKIRINPGNIGSHEKVRRIAEMAKSKGIPIRIGVNSGSLEKHLLDKYGGPKPEALVESAVRNVLFMTEQGFYDTIVSIKASDVCSTIRANYLFSTRLSNPLHIGVTEAGTVNAGTIKSSIGIGALLSQGIGDTIRVSLAASPVEEVKVGRKILASFGFLDMPQLIACPTCGRTEIDVIGLAEQLENRLDKTNKAVTVAVMGCSVNGPGEAREADIGIAGGKEVGVLFKEGKVIKKVPAEELLDTLLAEIQKMDG